MQIEHRVPDVRRIRPKLVDLQFAAISTDQAGVGRDPATDEIGKVIDLLRWESCTEHMIAPLLILFMRPIQQVVHALASLSNYGASGAPVSSRRPSISAFLPSFT